MHILLVEDAKSIARVMTLRLESHGHTVSHAINGERAVAMFSQGGPDLILMDVEMPVMNGFVAARQIRALEAELEWAWTPIIFLTSTDTVENLIAAIDAGGDDFLFKSAPEAVLRAKLTAMSRTAQLRQRLAQANAQIQRMADHDGLTGLYNRRYLDTELARLWAQSTPEGTEVAVLMLDVDNFKKYNDRYGHHEGDHCLKSVAAAIEAVVAQIAADGLCPQAFAARYGGEEFTVVLPCVTDAAYASVPERVLQAILGLRLKHESNPPLGFVTASVGASRAKPQAMSAAVMIQHADARLYEAKRGGRNQAVI